MTIAPAALEVVASAALIRPRTMRSSAGILIALVLAIADRYLEHLRATSMSPGAKFAVQGSTWAPGIAVGTV